MTRYLQVVRLWPLVVLLALLVAAVATPAAPASTREALLPARTAAAAAAPAAGCKVPRRHCRPAPAKARQHVSNLLPEGVLPPRVDTVGAYTQDIAVKLAIPTAFQYVVPSGFYAEVMIFSATYQSSATAGNRLVSIVVVTSTTSPLTSVIVPAPGIQTASESRNYTFAVDISSVNPGAGQPMSVQLPRWLWAPGTIIRLQGSGDLLLDNFLSTAFLRVALFPTGLLPVLRQPQDVAGATPLQLP